MKHESLFLLLTFGVLAIAATFAALKVSLQVPFVDPIFLLVCGVPLWWIPFILWYTLRYKIHGWMLFVFLLCLALQAFIIFVMFVPCDAYYEPIPNTPFVLIRYGLCL